MVARTFSRFVLEGSRFVPFCWAGKGSSGVNIYLVFSIRLGILIWNTFTRNSHVNRVPQTSVEIHAQALQAFLHPIMNRGGARFILPASLTPMPG